MRSYGQDAAAAAVVTSAPINPGNDLASTSLMDEDEDIPTVVAQPRGLEELSRGPRPAAGGGWDGNSTQLLAEGQGPSPGGFDSTIAMPDSPSAQGIQHRVDQMDRQVGQHDAGPHGVPVGQPMDYQGGSANQAAIETKMSLPRPAAVAQWLMEQGDVEIGGPRSTGVIIAIAALATLCVMGVVSLIVYKLNPPARPDPQTMVSTVPGAVASLLPEEDETFAGSYDKKKRRSLNLNRGRTKMR